MRTRLRTGIAVAAAALILAACGDDSGDAAAESTTQASTTTSARATTTVPTTTSAPATTTTESTTTAPTTTTSTTTTTTTTTMTTETTTTPEVVTPTVPSEGELQGKLQAALGGDSSQLESGNAASLGVVNSRISTLPGYSWSVTGPVTSDGSTVNANLNSCLAGQCFPIPVTFVNVGGDWKLSQASESQLVAYAEQAGQYLPPS